MAEFDAFVTDTHPLVFHAAASKRLGPAAARAFRGAEQGQATVYVPVAVLWELGLLAKRQRITLGRSLAEFAEDLFSNPSFQPLALTPGQVSLADEHRPNQDPFDALICAAALEIQLPLLTGDAEIEASGIVETVW